MPKQALIKTFAAKDRAAVFVTAIKTCRLMPRRHICPFSIDSAIQVHLDHDYGGARNQVKYERLVAIDKLNGYD